MRTLSLFCGCGGMDLGFKQAGYDLVWANDFEPAAVASYSTNLGSHVLCADVTGIDLESLPRADVVIGGFPCQGFSIVGTRRLDDSRNALYRSMKTVIERVQPQAFVAENVRGLTNLAGGAVLDAMIREFESTGYRVTAHLLNARHYGVPQNRERLFLVGLRHGERWVPPAPTHGDESAHGLFGVLERELTLGDALAGLGPLGSAPNHEIEDKWKNHPRVQAIAKHINEGQKLCNVRLGERSVYTWEIPEVFGEVTPVERLVLETMARIRRRKEFGPADGNPLSVEVIKAHSGQKRVESVLTGLVSKDYVVLRDGRYDLKHAFNGVYRRLRRSAPSEAVLTVFNSPRYYLHPTEPRPFSVRECARIQGFPDDFVFRGNLKEQYTQIGNAVPPPLARIVASSVMTHLGSCVREYANIRRA
jgi:DNA (cytosine-5)-methyltransferase 1